MKRFTLRERSALSFGPTGELDDRDVAAFARLQPSLPAKAFEWEHKRLRFGPYCGVLRAGDVTIEVLPKIDDGDESDEAARGMLIGMLRVARHVSVFGGGISQLSQQRLHLLDLFIMDFCARVNNVLRAGSIMSYQEHVENISALRGRIRLTEHLRVNAFNRARLFCGFDARTVDNPHNRALKAVLAVLRTKAFGSQAKATVAALLHRFGDVSDADVTPEDIERLHFDRLTSSWMETFQHAKWLIQGLFPDVRMGSIDGTCLLFNMESLFEAFVGAKLRDAWQRDTGGYFQVRLQGPRLDLASSDAGSAFSLRPDVAVLAGDRVARIFDAKWKALDPLSGGAGISTADVHQLASYAGRYACDRVALVYPASTRLLPGLVCSYLLNLPNTPHLDIHAIDVRSAVLGKELPSSVLPGVALDRHAAQQQAGAQRQIINSTSFQLSLP